MAPNKKYNSRSNSSYSAPAAPLPERGPGTCSSLVPEGEVRVALRSHMVVPYPNARFGNRDFRGRITKCYDETCRPSFSNFLWFYNCSFSLRLLVVFLFLLLLFSHFGNVAVSTCYTVRRFPSGFLPPPAIRNEFG